MASPFLLAPDADKGRPRTRRALPLPRLGYDLEYVPNLGRNR